VGSRIRAMDVVAVALGILMFGILLGLIYGIERI
jgi:ABC-type dipeptide/oligopeptide/nickel transport system permease subunit